MKKNKLSAAIISASIVGTLPIQVNAQEEQFVLEEVIVTAKKRETALQDTSATIVALQDNLLSERSVVAIEDLQGVLPGASVGEDEIGLELTIRGVSNGAGQTGEASIAFHSDGVYSIAPTALFYDLERIEIIYGPQGTLYGRNATGGALNVISNKPKADVFYGNIEQTIGNYSRSMTKAMVNVPVIEDVLALRVAGVVEDRDGYSTNSLTGERAGRINDRSSTRISLGYTPNDEFSLIVRAITNKYKGTNGGNSTPDLQEVVDPLTNTPITPSADALAQLTPAQIAKADAFNFPRFDEGVRSIDEKSFSVDLSWNINDNMVLNYIGGIKDADSGGSMGDQTFSTSTLGDIQVNDVEESSHELRLSSDNDNDLQWMVGLFTFESERESEILLDFNNGGFFDFIFVDTSSDKATSDAIFASFSYQINKALNLRLGVRHSEDEKTRVETSLNQFSFPSLPAPFVNDNKENFDSTDWSLGIDYQLSEDHLLYFNASTGYKAGGLNSVSSAFPSFDQEEIFALEAGSKSRLSDHLILNGAVFSYDYEDYQVLVQNPINFTESTVDNADSVDFLGATVELQYVDTQMLLTANISYLDAEFDNGTLLYDPVLGRDVNVGGFTLKKAPEFSGTLGATYHWPLAEGTISVSGNLFFSSKTNLAFTPLVDSQGRRVDTQDSYQRLDLSTTYETNSGNLIQLFVKNVTDEEIATGFGGYDSIDGLIAYNYDAPRTYGVRFSVNF